ncbi:MAG: hypothetical protein AAF449_04635 [Myxococcota bacterium]
MSEVKKVDTRVQAHVERLRAAGLDTQRFFDALVAIRDDHSLPAAHRTALYRLIASECSIWYLEALRGAPLDRAQMMEEAFRINEQNAAAIKQRTPGDGAHALAESAKSPTK